MTGEEYYGGGWEGDRFTTRWNDGSEEGGRWAVVGLDEMSIRRKCRGEKIKVADIFVDAYDEKEEEEAVPISRAAKAWLINEWVFRHSLELDKWWNNKRG